MQTREEIMLEWDSWRRYIRDGGGGSWPRDAFEALLDGYDEEIERLRKEGRVTMNARQRKELMCKLEQIETCKAAIAKSRDQLRSLVSDVEDIIASLDEADDTLASGLWPLQKGVDDTSEYL